MRIYGFRIFSGVVERFRAVAIVICHESPVFPPHPEPFARGISLVTPRPRFDHMRRPYI
jgi:hypothetical protein